MKKLLPLFVFIDACGWEIIKELPFAKKFAPHRRRLTSVFGYSSACIPSILSGAWPVEHRNWCYFVYDPKNSPFRGLRSLRFLPRALTSRRRFRRWLSKFIKVQLNFRGYFDLYNIPFRYISLFDFTEKKSPLQPAGMNRGTNIFDFLVVQGIPYHVSDPARGETKNMADLITRVEAENIDFAFVYWPELDGLLHRVGNLSPEVPAKLAVYEERIEELLRVAREHYEEVRLYIFSDHGMANCDRLLDLRAKVEQLPVRMERDYAVVYDSTMARFWFFNENARKRITECLQQVPEGRIVPDEEMKEMGTFFADRYFGELIFLMQEGVLIVPSHMGERPLRAMHGYHPTDPQSYAALMTNQGNVAADVTAIPDIYRLMTAQAQESHRANKPEAGAMSLTEGALESASAPQIPAGAERELISLRSSITTQKQGTTNT